MEKGLIVALKSRFDTIAHVDEESGIEFWYARELQKELGYQRWENFMIAIERAETACEESKIECHNHFREVTKMVTIGSSAEGERSITAEHVHNNRAVRNMLGQRGIKPENLPPEEDIKKIERRVASEEKKLAQDSGFSQK